MVFQGPANLAVSFCRAPLSAGTLNVFNPEGVTADPRDTNLFLKCCYIYQVHVHLYVTNVNP